MYRAFNVSSVNWDSLQSISAADAYNKTFIEIRRSLDAFVDNGIVDGTKLSSHWFPTVKADVFISHSHNDESAAIKCASWLKDRFDLDSFVDSCIWGHAAELLKKIDDVYCLNPSRDTYDYEKRNQSTSHIHMMLAKALNGMLDTTECVFFLNTPNSITTKEVVSKTESPWLSYELSSLRTIRRRRPRRILVEYEFSKGSTKAASLDVEYVAPLDELTSINGNDLNNWRESCASSHKKKGLALEVLYKLHPEPDTD